MSDLRQNTSVARISKIIDRVVHSQPRASLNFSTSLVVHLSLSRTLEVREERERSKTIYTQSTHPDPSL